MDEQAILDFEDEIVSSSVNRMAEIHRSLKAHPGDERGADTLSEKIARAQEVLVTRGYRVFMLRFLAKNPPEWKHSEKSGRGWEDGYKQGIRKNLDAYMAAVEIVIQCTFFIDEMACDHERFTRKKPQDPIYRITTDDLVSLILLSGAIFHLRIYDSNRYQQYNDGERDLRNPWEARRPFLELFKHVLYAFYTRRESTGWHKVYFPELFAMYDWCQNITEIVDQKCSAEKIKLTKMPGYDFENYELIGKELDKDDGDIRGAFERFKKKEG